MVCVGFCYHSSLAPGLTQGLFVDEAKVQNEEGIWDLMKMSINCNFSKKSGKPCGYQNQRYPHFHTQERMKTAAGWKSNAFNCWLNVGLFVDFRSWQV
jgi:hypothetical protein